MVHAHAAKIKTGGARGGGKRGEIGGGADGGADGGEGGGGEGGGGEGGGTGMDSCRRGWHPPSARGMPSMHGGDGGHPMQSSFALDEAGSGGAVSSSMQHNRLVRVSCAMSSAVTAVAMERRRRAAASTMEGGSERASVSVVLSGQGSCSNTVNMQLLIRIGAAMRPRLYPVGPLAPALGARSVRAAEAARLQD